MPGVLPMHSTTTPDAAGRTAGQKIQVAYLPRFLLHRRTLFMSSFLLNPFPSSSHGASNDISPMMYRLPCILIAAIKAKPLFLHHCVDRWPSVAKRKEMSVFAMQMFGQRPPCDAASSILICRLIWVGHRTDWVSFLF